MTNRSRSSKKGATQAPTTAPTAARTAVVVEGQPLTGAAVSLTPEQEEALRVSREAEFTATENSLAQRVADSGYWWVDDGGSMEHYIGKRPKEMDDPRLAKVIQLNPLTTLRNFDGREVRLEDGTRFTIQGDIQTVDQIRTPDGELLIGPVDKALSAARRKAAEERWAAEDEARAAATV